MLIASNNEETYEYVLVRIKFMSSLLTRGVFCPVLLIDFEAD